MATAADLAGTEAPDSLDSISLLPAILGRNEEQGEHDYLYWEFYGQGTRHAARQGPWKAIRQPMHTGVIELYDLGEDRSEARDVASEHPQVARHMKDIVEAAHTPSSIWQAPSEE